MNILIISIVILSVLTFLVALSDNNEKRRKRWGLNQYQIVKNDWYEDATIKQTTYFIKQKCKLPVLGIQWLDVQYQICGMGDCYWNTKYFSTLKQAEDAVKRLQDGHKWHGHKETIIKYIP